MKKLIILLTIAILAISCCRCKESQPKQNASEKVYGSQTQEDPNKSSRIKIVARSVESSSREYQIVEIDGIEYIVVLYNQGGIAITPLIKK